MQDQRNQPPIAVAFTEILLRKIRMRVSAAVSPYLLREARPEIVMDVMSDRLIASLDTHVMGQEETKTYRIIEEPVYPTWKHHLVASLPERSWRRRYLTNFFLLEAQPLARRRVHEVTAYGRAVFPEAEIQMPPEWGHVYRLAAVEDSPYWENLPPT